MAQATQITPAQFQERYGISESTYKRHKSKIAQPDLEIVVRVGKAYFISEQALPLLIESVNGSKSQVDRANEPANDTPMTGQVNGALALSRPGQLGEVIDAEFVPEVQELQIVLPDHSAATAAAQLEIANTAQIASGNRNLRRQLRRKALIEQAQREAIEDFAAADKAYESMVSGLEQQGLNQIGLGGNASPVAATAPATASTEAPAKKQQQ